MGFHADAVTSAMNKEISETCIIDNFSCRSVD